MQSMTACAMSDAGCLMFNMQSIHASISHGIPSIDTMIMNTRLRMMLNIEVKITIVNRVQSASLAVLLCVKTGKNSINMNMESMKKNG
jgi:hypothetical protein